MPSLSAQERVELQQAVSVHGRDWRAMAAAGACGGRAEDALRKAWDKLSAVGIVAAAEVVAEPVLSPLITGPVLPLGATGVTPASLACPLTPLGAEVLFFVFSFFVIQIT